MFELGLTWIAMGLFALVIVWGTDVPGAGRRPVLGSLIVVMVLFGLFAQTFYFVEQGGGLERKLSAAEAMAAENSELRAAVAQLAMMPGELRGARAGWEFYKVVTSSFAHYGWLPLALNVWFIFVFGYVLEGLIGRIRFGLVVLAGLVVPALMDGFLPRVPFTGTAHFTGGASGIVYAVFGAALVRLPRARVYVALNTAMDFWGLTLVLLLPMTFIASLVDFSLVQLLLLIGITTLFLTIQPPCRSVAVPLWWALLFKLVLDVVLIWPMTAGVVSNSPWRIVGGLMTGGAVGLALCGTRGFRETWSSEPPPRLRRRGKGTLSLDALERAAKTDAEAARAYLGQRVFIGDVARVLAFYRDVVMEKFPDLILPPQEQLALARLLQSKARDGEALHAYENYLKAYDPDAAQWGTWLTTAELLLKVEPGRAEDARRYLRRFLENDKILLREKVEADRLLKELPAETAQVEATDAGAVVNGGVVEERLAGEKLGRDGLEEEVVPAAVKAVEQEKADDVLMPRLKPMSFHVVDGAVQEDRHRVKKESVDEEAAAELTKLYWKLHPVRERPDQKEEALFPVKVKHSYDMQSELSGAYGVDGGGEGTARVGRGGRGRMARIEAARSDRYGLANEMGMMGGKRRSAGKEGDDESGRGIPKNYGGATEGLAGGERPRIRLAREVRKREEGGAGGGT